MLLIKTDSGKYINEFKDKFTNFAQKAPILISFISTDSGVSVIHENSGIAYEFEWDYTIPVKSFIHEIKQVLSDNHYPRLVDRIVNYVPVTSDEAADLIAKGVSVNDIPTSKEVVTTNTYRIDKVIALKDIFIIQDEKTHRSYRYKMNSSSIFFLKKYRTGKFSSLEEAGKFFFEKSELLGELTGKE